VWFACEAAALSQAPSNVQYYPSIKSAPIFTHGQLCGPTSKLHATPLTVSVSSKLWHAMQCTETVRNGS